MPRKLTEQEIWLALRATALTLAKNAELENREAFRKCMRMLEDIWELLPSEKAKK